jgi:hypothetical protein
VGVVIALKPSPGRWKEILQYSRVHGNVKWKARRTRR